MPIASGLELSVDIADSTSHDITEIDYEQDISNLQEIDFSVENTGSIGCKYQAKAVFEDDNMTEEAWSDAESLWPGDSKELELRHVFSNHTGEADSTVYITYCGQEIEVETFDFDLDAEVVDDDTEIRSNVVEFNQSSAVVRVDSEEGYLVPVDSPGLWRASTSQIDSEKAVVNYNPPIFRERSIEYYVVGNGQVQGVTEVDISEPEGFMETVERYVDSIRLKL